MLELGLVLRIRNSLERKDIQGRACIWVMEAGGRRMHGAVGELLMVLCSWESMSVCDHKALKKEGKEEMREALTRDTQVKLRKDSCAILRNLICVLWASESHFKWHDRNSSLEKAEWRGTSWCEGVGGGVIERTWMPDWSARFYCFDKEKLQKPSSSPSTMIGKHFHLKEAGHCSCFRDYTWKPLWKNCV